MQRPRCSEATCRRAAKDFKKFRMQRLCKQPFFLRTATTITATMLQAWGNMKVGTSLASACGHPCIVRNAANAETANIYALLVDLCFMCEALCMQLQRKLHQWPRLRNRGTPPKAVGNVAMNAWRSQGRYPCGGSTTGDGRRIQEIKTRG